MTFFKEILRNIYSQQVWMSKVIEDQFSPHFIGFSRFFCPLSSFRDRGTWILPAKCLSDSFIWGSHLWSMPPLLFYFAQGIFGLSVALSNAPIIFPTRKIFLSNAYMLKYQNPVLMESCIGYHCWCLYNETLHLAHKWGKYSSNYLTPDFDLWYCYSYIKWGSVWLLSVFHLVMSSSEGYQPGHSLKY